MALARKLPACIETVVPIAPERRTIEVHERRNGRAGGSVQLAPLDGSEVNSPGGTAGLALAAVDVFEGL